MAVKRDLESSKIPVPLPFVLLFPLSPQPSSFPAGSVSALRQRPRDGVFGVKNDFPGVPGDLEESGTIN